MKNNKPTWILIAFLANLALLPLVAAAPGEGRARENREAIFFNCCKKTTAGRPYCCDRCCFFTWNCQVSEDCADRNRHQ